MGETKREKRQLVEDFRRFLQIWSLICKVSGLERRNCRKPQETARNRRKSQKAVSTPFSHLVSPIKRSPSFPLSTKRLKSDPQSDSKVTFGAQKVSFWSLLSLFVERGRSLFLVSSGSDKSFLDSEPVAASRFHKPIATKLLMKLLFAARMARFELLRPIWLQQSEHGNQDVIEHYLNFKGR